MAIIQIMVIIWRPIAPPRANTAPLVGETERGRLVSDLHRRAGGEADVLERQLIGGAHDRKVTTGEL